MKLPQELTSRKQFLLWGMNAHRPKQPYSPVTLSPDNWQDPDNWDSFEKAIHHANQDNERRGIGFAFNGGGIIGVDLDNVFANGQLIPEAQDIVNSLDSFTEQSMSGNGLHIYVYAPGVTLGVTKASFPFPCYKKEEKRHVEFYESAGYFAMTGKPYSEYRPMPDRGKQLTAVFARYGNKPKETPQAEKHTTPTTPAPAIGEDDEHFLRVGIQKDRVLTVLYNGHHRTGDESADDQSLMNKLAYWTNRNETLMRDAFLNSPYCNMKSDEQMKKVCERADYLPRTIKTAISSSTKTAREKDIEWKSAQAAKANKKTHQSQEPPKQDTEWEQPVPFDIVEIPSFPVECLPPTLRDYVLMVSESTQTPADMAAVKALAVIATCVQGKFKIEPKPDWREPLNLYIATVANPAERKSSIDGHLVNVIREYETEKNNANKTLINRSRIRRKTLERIVDNLIAKIANQQATEAELNTAQDDLTNFVDTKPLRLFADDTTSEALISTLAENGGRLSVISSEGGLFNIMAGLYTNGKANLDAFLKAHSGDSIRVDRKGRPSEDIPDPCLTIALSIQPQVLEEVIGNGSFRGRGLPARFLYSIPVSRIGNRIYDVETISPECKSRYKEMCYDLMDIKNDSPAILRLSDEADELSRQFYYSLEPRLNDDLEDCLDWAGKYHGGVMRIAGILHCAEQLVFADTTPVKAETMQSAIKIGECFLEHALIAYRMMGVNSAVKDARYILAQLEKRRPEKFKAGDILAWCKRLKNVDEIKPGLDALIEHNFVREHQPEYTGQGRPPAVEYIVNPLHFSAAGMVEPKE